MANLSHQLTESSALHFPCRDPKDCYDLDHNLDDYVYHSSSWCDTNVYFEPMEETFDAVKNFNELVLPSAGIFSRLGTLGVKIGCEET